MKVYTFSDASADFEGLINRVAEKSEQALVKMPDGRCVVIVSEQEWRAMLETVHLLSSPANAVPLLASVKQLQSPDSKENSS